MDALPDVLEPNLKVIFCGTAVGAASAKLGAYYAGPGNKFWKIIHEIGLTDRLLKPQEYRDLPNFGIGLTDIAKLVSGADSTLRAEHFDKERLCTRIRELQPRALAFNGKKAAQVFLQHLFPKQPYHYGRLPDTVGKTRVYVLPSTSGAASGYWKKEPWCNLARDLCST